MQDRVPISSVVPTDRLQRPQRHPQVFSPLLIRELPAAPLSATLGIIYMGVFPGALSYAIWSQVLQRLPASSAASLLYLVPILSVALAWVILRETPTAMSLLGGALVLLGVVAVNWRR